MSSPVDFSEVRPRRSGMEVRLTRYFTLQGVGAEAAAALAAGSFMQINHPGDRMGARKYVDIVLSGVVAEDNRLWASGWWLGDLDVFRETPQVYSRSSTEFLCPTWTIRIARDVLRSWAMRDLSVQRMLHQILVYRFQLHDVVYGLDQRSTLARLARLMDYLAHRSDDLDRARLLPPGHDTLYGPTQKHLADALGLSLASVEKSMSVLRKHGVLASSGKGRANRAYAILMPDLLRAVAHGHTLSAA